jgi:hypothetical protein
VEEGEPEEQLLVDRWLAGEVEEVVVQFVISTAQIGTQSCKSAGNGEEVRVKAGVEVRADEERREGAMVRNRMRSNKLNKVK